MSSPAGHFLPLPSLSPGDHPSCPLHHWRLRPASLSFPPLALPHICLFYSCLSRCSFISQNDPGRDQCRGCGHGCHDPTRLGHHLNSSNQARTHLLGPSSLVPVQPLSPAATPKGLSSFRTALPWKSVFLSLCSDCSPVTAGPPHVTPVTGGLSPSSFQFRAPPAFTSVPLCRFLGHVFSYCLAIVLNSSDPIFLSSRPPGKKAPRAQI